MTLRFLAWAAGRMKSLFTEKGTLLKEFGRLPTRHSSACVKLLVGYSSPEFSVDVGLGFIFGHCSPYRCYLKL